MNIPARLRGKLCSCKEPSNPENLNVDYLKGFGGQELRVAIWEAAGREQGTVFLLVGYAEFVELYYELVDFWMSLGYRVVTYDHRGQGFSRRFIDDIDKGYVDSFDAYFEDVKLVFKEYVDGHPGDCLLYGHSLGGHLALGLLEEAPKTFTAAVLSAPMLGFFYSTKFIHWVAGAWDATGFGASYAWLSKPSEEITIEELLERTTSFEPALEDYMELVNHCPILAQGGVTWHWLAEACQSLEKIMNPEAIMKNTTPTLVIAAELDSVVNPQYYSELSSLAPSVYQVETVSGSQHNMYMEQPEIRARFEKLMTEFVSRFCSQKEGEYDPAE